MSVRGSKTTKEQVVWSCNITAVHSQGFHQSWGILGLSDGESTAALGDVVTVVRTCLATARIFHGSQHGRGHSVAEDGLQLSCLYLSSAGIASVCYHICLYTMLGTKPRELHDTLCALTYIYPQSLSRRTWELCVFLF